MNGKSSCIRNKHHEKDFSCVLYIVNLDTYNMLHKQGMSHKRHEQGTQALSYSIRTDSFTITDSMHSDDLVEHFHGLLMKKKHSQAHC